jgi:hypothetical protein
MKKVLTATFVFTMAFVEVACSTQYQADNDGTGNFIFNGSSNLLPVPFRDGAQIDGIRQQNITDTWNGSATWTANVNANDMMINITNFGVTGSGSFSGVISTGQSIWIPGTTGFGGQPGYWTDPTQITPTSYSCTYEYSSVFHDNSNSVSTIDSYSPFSFNAYVSGDCTVTGTLMIGSQVVPFTKESVDSATLSGTFSTEL